MNLDKVCKFTKYYEDTGDTKYNLFVISVFYYNKYMRLGAKGVYSNKSIERQFSFLKNLIANIESLYNGVIPKDWKIRIYYDESLMNFNYDGVKIWDEFIDTVIKLKKVQLVKFECPKYFNKKNYQHIKLFGTLMRFYPLFEKEKNVISVNCIDADNFITKPWMHELVKFVKSDYDINVFCSKYEFPRYGDIKNKRNFECYFRAGIISSKVQFGINEWEKSFKEIENPKSDFMEMYNRVIKRLNIFFPNELRNKDSTFFEFGFDEMFLNFFIKEIIQNNNYKVRYVHYQTSLNIFLDYLLVILNNKVNETYTKELLQQPNSPYQTTEDMYKEMKKSIRKRTFFEKKKFLLKHLDILEKMDIDPVILNFIQFETKKTFFKYPRFDTYLKILRINNNPNNIIKKKFKKKFKKNPKNPKK